MVSCSGLSVEGIFCLSYAIDSSITEFLQAAYFGALLSKVKHT